MNRYMIRIPSDVVDSPILATTILETGTLMNILRAKVDYDEGIIVVSVLGDEEEQRNVVASLQARGVEVKKLSKNITNNKEKCVSCGACVSLCPTEAISFNPDLVIDVDGSKCIRCGACVVACPVKSLSIQEL